MLNGLLDFSPWQVLLYTLVVTHITIISVTIYLHRFSAHRAIDLHPALQHFFRFWLWFTTGTNTKEWTAIHRKHHAKCETDEDPHSPHRYGIKTLLLTGAELYQAEAKNLATLEQYGKGTPEDWIERNIYRHTFAGLTLMFVMNIFLLGPIGITVWAVQMMWIPIFAAGIINGIGHYWGYRNFELEDASTNIVPWGILIGGEELHNNHHAFPNSARLSYKPWEFDLGWFYISLLRSLRLAKVNQVSPKLHQLSHKLEVDIDTVKAVITNRWQVMANYQRTVLRPIILSEKEKASASYEKLIQQCKKLIARNPARISLEEDAKLKQLLTRNSALHVAYEYRLKLQAIWEKTSASKTELLHALMEWCKEAEATGIHYLEEFSRNLKTYTLQPVTA